MQETGLSVEGWLSRRQQPIDPTITSYSKVARHGEPGGPIAGEQVVFTGALSMPRREAAELAAKAGCDVGESVSKKKTTLLIVGDPDTRKLAGHEKSLSIGKRTNSLPLERLFESSVRVISADWSSLAE